MIDHIHSAPTQTFGPQKNSDIHVLIDGNDEPQSYDDSSPKRTPEIADAITENEELVAGIHGEIEALASRLKPVLSECREADEADKAHAGRGFSSPLARQIEAHNDGLHGALAQLRRLRHEIEV
ncbi:hypothetical protein [Salinisphaera sp.]|uniref:hypothetical protein n=1 Tax=Salinisphaera sp. TaxID=1914330 RepID=UPI000C41A9A6|nr:hypothetical protein [Salinisphaera sp.]MAS09910.1 hypothetical protein [Salinisphaera sp.]MAS09965.1 hypothetical protein [Salinisphaera sp.]|tara:strand:+ start:24489 stop:24860 length:372 start_codon:yes stop_codon:yes gene_type:complete